MQNKNKLPKNLDVMELSDDVMDQVTGGVHPLPPRIPAPSTPSTPSMPSTPTETFAVPVKGEETVHLTVEIRDGETKITEPVY